MHSDLSLSYFCDKCSLSFNSKYYFDIHKKRKLKCNKKYYIYKNLALDYDIHNIHIYKPFIKWVGGKSQIILDVISLFPRVINNYYEPFLGGGSIILALLSFIKSGIIKIKGNIYASDLNPNIIYMYQNIQSNPHLVIQEIDKLSSIYYNIKIMNGGSRKPSSFNEAIYSQESYYYWTRDVFNSLSIKDRNTPYASALMIFLNKTCFRGIYREGPRGFNVPFGNYKSPSFINSDYILQVSQLIKPVIFKHKPFEATICYLDVFQRNDFIYLDPPYAPENIKSFVGYTSEGFNINTHKLLFNTCNEIYDFSNKYNYNIKFLMSNSDVPLINEYFGSNINNKLYKKNIILCKRTINSKNPQSKTNEVLIRNY